MPAGRSCAGRFQPPTVLDALPEACKVDEALCRRVRRYLNAYMGRYAVSHAEHRGGRDARTRAARCRTVAGMSAEDAWTASLAAHYQPSDYVLLQLGGVAYPDETMASGSFLSLGYEYAQLDIGYREHWWSPMTDSSMLIGTQARAMPGITLSNYTPMTKLGFRYEMFMAQHEPRRRHRLRWTARPLAIRDCSALQVSIDPVRGWTLSASRILQYGGGERDDSLSGLFDGVLLPGCAAINTGDRPGLRQSDCRADQPVRVPDPTAVRRLLSIRRRRRLAQRRLAVGQRSRFPWDSICRGCGIASISPTR